MNDIDICNHGGEQGLSVQECEEETKRLLEELGLEV